MNQAHPSAPPAAAPRRFIIELIGFADAEKAMLISTFRLTGRRAFFYSEATSPNDRTDIYLASSDNPAALKEVAERLPNAFAPAVLIGRTPVESEWSRVEKPIHWMRLFEQLDSSMLDALRARAKRKTENDAKWDGRTLRRAIDKDAPPEEVYVESSPNESVMVVDDSATVRAFMRAKLAPFRFDVDFAENGETAIDMAQAKRYTCIFLDIMMPGIDGYQVCKRIKASSATKNTAVVMLSSKAGTFDKIRGNWAGCDAYLSKPVAEDELLATIAKFLPSARKVIQAS